MLKMLDKFEKEYYIVQYKQQSGYKEAHAQTATEFRRLFACKPLNSNIMS